MKNKLFSDDVFNDNSPNDILFEYDDKDTQEIKQKIKNLKTELHFMEKNFGEKGRASGRTTRIINDVIDKMFSCPVNTPVLLKDHYPSRHIVDEFNRRMKYQFPDVKYIVKQSIRDPYSFDIYRKTETAFEQINQKMNDIECQIKKLEKLI